MTDPTKQFTCEDVFRRLDDFLDRELTPAEMMLVQAHLDSCAQCASEHRFERRVLDDVRAKLGRIKAPHGLLQRVRQVLEDPS